MFAEWLAFDIGCIECGEPSGVIGLYATKEEAEAACERASVRHRDDWKGQHYMAVFNLVADNDRSAYADG